MHTWRRGKKIITEEVIVISDTDEELTSVKSGPDKLIKQLKKEPVEEPLAESKWEEAVRSNYSNKRINFDMKLYKGMVPTVVKKIPHNVDGLKYFIMMSLKKKLSSQSTEMEDTLSYTLQPGIP